MLKRIDFHIHTISTRKDSSFVFNIDSLKNYVISQSIAAIAITNHNTFDLDQYHQICSCTSCLVFPGIEVDLEKGHILVIAPKEKITQFTEECKLIDQMLSYKETLVVNEFLKVFPKLDEYLVIPHYQKKPKISSSVLDQLSNYISAGEVESPKKWQVCKKDLSCLPPVLFSDLRIESSCSVSTRQTLLDIDEIDIPKIKAVLIDHSKIHLHESKIDSTFPILPDGTCGSTRLNVIIGKRSSGKSHTLQRIEKEYPYTTKNIEQFELIERNSEAKFKENIKSQHEDIANHYLLELRNTVESFQSIDLDRGSKTLERFTRTLVDYATKQEFSDIYSKAKLFNEPILGETSINAIKRLIDSTFELLEPGDYAIFVNKYIPRQSLIDLLIDLINEYRSLFRQNKLLNITNSITSTIKNLLSDSSSLTPISEINFPEIFRNSYQIRKFNRLIDEGGRERVISSKQYGNFKIQARITPIINVTDLKNELKTQKGMEEIKKLSPIYKLMYLQKHRESLNIELSDLYKSFWKIDFEIKNENGLNLSGGEKSEYNLLKALEDAANYEIVLIDELESSFDNLFLNQNIVVKLQRIADESTLFLVTHNNTLGLLLNPDCVIYTEKTTTDGKPQFKLYTGSLTSPKLVNPDGSSVSSYSTLMETMEAGEPAYTKRRSIYESLKN